MEEDLVNIYGTGQPYVAELLRQMLADHDIQCYIINKQDYAYKFGDIELYVHRDNVIRAKKLIQEFEKQ